MFVKEHLCMHLAWTSAVARTTFAACMLSPCSWQLMQYLCTNQVSQHFWLEQAACQKVTAKHSMQYPKLVILCFVMCCCTDPVACNICFLTCFTDKPACYVRFPASCHDQDLHILLWKRRGLYGAGEALCSALCRR